MSRWRFLQESVAQNPACPEEVLTYLSWSKNPLVRLGVAENPSCPKDLLEALAKDPSPYVRRGVAKNPATPLDLLKALVKDPEVRDEVLSNPAFPLPLAVEAALKGGWEDYYVTDRLSVFGPTGQSNLDHLDNLPKDPKLWTLLWKRADSSQKKIISTHPYGKQIAFLARLGGD